MPLERNRTKSPEQEAKKILDRFSIKTAPVPVIEIAKKMNLKVIPYDLGEDVSGVLVMENGKGTIGFHPGNNRMRQRFTIAHELGHYILHSHPGSANEIFIDKDFYVKYRSEKKYTKTEITQEQAANAFAAELLMPKFLIKAEISSNDYGDLTEMEFIEKLAKIFEVSAAAMSIRASRLDLFS